MIREPLSTFTLNWVEYTVVCYDFFNDIYWCKYTTQHGDQFKWVSAKEIEKSN